MIKSAPRSRTWSSFLADYWDNREENLYRLDYTSSTDAFYNGKGQISAAWRVLYMYRGRYTDEDGNKSTVTRNVVDIQLGIPENNLLFQEHFTYSYFQPKLYGKSVEAVVKENVEAAIKDLYQVYFQVPEMPGMEHRRRNWRCVQNIVGGCDHAEMEPISHDIVAFLPKSFYDDRYENDTRVSTTKLLHLSWFLCDST
jgi:hypothetical protein